MWIRNKIGELIATSRRLDTGTPIYSAGIAATWQLVRVATQVVWLVMIARLLGVEGYGTFAGTAAMATAASTLVGMGMGLVMLRKVGRDRSLFPAMWHRTIALTAKSGIILAILLPAPILLLLGGTAPSMASVVAIAVTELIALPLILMCSYAFQAHDRMGLANLVMVIQPAASLVAVLLALTTEGLTGRPTGIAIYALLHAGMALAACLLAVILVYRVLHPEPASHSKPVDGLIREGMGLSAMRVTDTILGSLDKTLVLRIAGAEIAGLYTLCYRMASVLSIPVASLAMAAFPRLLLEQDGAREKQRLHSRLLATSVGAGLIAALAMWLTAAAIPWVLGSDFAEATAMARQLIAAPGLLGLSAMACSILLARHQALARTLVQIGGVVLMSILAAMLLSPDRFAGPALMLQGTLLFTSTALWAIVLLGNPSAGAGTGYQP